MTGFPSRTQSSRRDSSASVRHAGTESKPTRAVAWTSGRRRFRRCRALGPAVLSLEDRFEPTGRLLAEEHFVLTSTQIYDGTIW